MDAVPGSASGHTRGVQAMDDLLPADRGSPEDIHSQAETSRFTKLLPLHFCSRLAGVGGVVYALHTLKPLIELGLDACRATKLAFKLQAHSAPYAYKLASTRCALKKTPRLLETLLVPNDFFLFFFL
eukprot:scaffold185537_cov16-Tisochrysis_lutea.AAC.1